MEEDKDIKILEDYLDKQDRKFVSEHRLMILQAAENLIARYKELEEQIQRKEGIIKHLENSKAKYYEDNVRLLRKNGHIDILSDNLHYKYWDDVKNYIPKSKVQEKIDEIHNEPMNYSPDEYWIENECKGYCIDKMKELIED